MAESDSARVTLHTPGAGRPVRRDRRFPDNGCVRGADTGARATRELDPTLPFRAGPDGRGERTLGVRASGGAAAQDDLATAEPPRPNARPRWPTDKSIPETRHKTATFAP